MVVSKNSVIHWRQESGSSFGIGDFVIQLPAIRYFIEDIGCLLHYYATDKFKCLLPKHENLIVHDYHDESSSPILPKWGWDMDYCYNHVSAVWLPAIERFKRNFILFKKEANFVYPRIEFSPVLYKSVLKRLGLQNQNYFTFIKVAYHRERNWTESGWSKLLPELTKQYVGINVGLTSSPKNSFSYTPDNNTIQLDDSFSLLEIAHLMHGQEFHIGLDTGMYHLATAVGARKICVLWHPCNTQFEWLYPNTTIIHKAQPDKLVIDDILEQL